MIPVPAHHCFPPDRTPRVKRMPTPSRSSAPLVIALLALGFVFGWLDSPPLLADEPNPPAARWFKGNLHTHSLWSDGDDFPEMIADWYRQAGYHFLALSDHNQLSDGAKWMPVDAVVKRSGKDALEPYRRRFGADWCQTRTVAGQLQVRLKPLAEFRGLLEQADRFLLIQSEEITDHVGPLPLHINAHNLRDAIQPQGGQTIREAMTKNLAAVERQSERTGRPILAHLNHPNYEYGVTAEDLAAVVGERFFEIYNGHPAVNQLGDAKHPSVERIWDIANTIRLADLKSPPLFGLANDDAHQYFNHSGASPGRGWVQVRARRLTPESLIAAIRQGDFYASSGVTLDDVRFDPASGELAIEIHPDGDAHFTTQFIGTRRVSTADAESPPAADAPPADTVPQSETSPPADAGSPADPAPSTTAAPQTTNPSLAVGAILATVEGLAPHYTLTGDEWYVRALVTSSNSPANPSYKAQKAQAWTQPVGWEKWLTTAAPVTAEPAPAAPAIPEVPPTVPQ
jgi:hypothetical protein